MNREGLENPHIEQQAIGEGGPRVQTKLSTKDLTSFLEGEFTQFEKACGGNRSTASPVGLFCKTGSALIQIYNYSKTTAAWVAQNDHEAQVSGDIEAKKRLAELERFISIYGGIKSVSACFYCSEPTLLWKTHEDREHRGNPYDDALNAIDLAICRRCGWYRYTIADFQDGYIIVSHRAATLSVEKRNINETPIHELKRYLSKNWDERMLISARQAEELVADIFREHLDCEIEYTTNGVYHPDGGIDFVLVNTDEGIRYAFQVKRRLTDSPERIQPIREFIGSVAQSRFKHGFFVTTADRFTQYANDELTAKRPLLELRDIKLTLVDGRRLLDLMKHQTASPQTARVIQDYFYEACKWKSNDIEGSHGIRDVLSLTFKQ